MRVTVPVRFVFFSSLLLALPVVQAAPPRIAPEPLTIQAPPAPAIDGDQNSANSAEKKSETSVIYELLEQVTQLQQEVSALREFAEQQEHKMNLLTKRQRSLYQDIDRRMLELEAGSSRSSGSGAYRSSSSGLVVNNNSTVQASNNSSPIAEDDPAQEQAAYTRAFKLLTDGNYARAITAFQEFLQTHGKGKFADNAQYWLGEANYAIRDYKTALVEFQKILTDYTDSPKRKDAELKIGFTYYELKDWEAARRALEAVITNFPDTPNARTARQRLDRMTREGR